MQDLVPHKKFQGGDELAGVQLLQGVVGCIGHVRKTPSAETWLLGALPWYQWL